MSPQLMQKIRVHPYLHNQANSRWGNALNKVNRREGRGLLHTGQILGGNNPSPLTHPYPPLCAGMSALHLPESLLVPFLKSSSDIFLFIPFPSPGQGGALQGPDVSIDVSPGK